MALRGEMSFHGSSDLGVFRDLAGALFLPLPAAWGLFCGKHQRELPTERVTDRLKSILN